MREQGRALFKPSRTIRTTKLYHRQVYEYAYHQPKLAFLRASAEHACGRGFTPAPPELRAKTYPLRVILDAVTLYNLGSTLAEASAKLKTKSGYRVPPSTIAAWVAEHRELTVAHCHRCTVSNFFRRDPLRESGVLPQFGQRPGCLAV